MKKRFIILVSIITVSLIVSVSALLIAKNTSNSPPATQITCNIIQENRGGINLVFFATEEQAKKYSDYLLTIAPFTNHKDRFNFYYITPEQYQPDCEIYRGIALLCHSPDLIKVASACPNDYIVVLNERPSSIRSSAFKGVMSLNTNHPLTVFAHEFAHVFDNFAEEYLAEGASIPRGSENCQKRCSDFREFPETAANYECHQECTNSNYYREFENGFMRSLHASRYGNFDEGLLDEEVLQQYRGDSTITGRAIDSTSYCDDQQYYLIEGSQEQGFTTTLEQGCPNEAKTFGESVYQITDDSGSIVAEEQLHSGILFTTDYNPSDGIITAAPEIVETPAIITIPATGDEETLTVLDDEGSSVYQTSLMGIGARPCKT